MTISCGSTKKGFGYDPDADFSQYKTFAFSTATNSGVKSMTKNRILSAIENELLTKGIQTSDSPDMIVDVVANKTQETNSSKTSVNNPWHFGAWAGFEGTYTYVNVQNEASLVISMVDAQTQKMIWVGSSTKHLKDEMVNSPKTSEINKTVKKILKHYPPQKK